MVPSKFTNRCCQSFSVILICKPLNQQWSNSLKSSTGLILFFVDETTAMSGMVPDFTCSFHGMRTPSSIHWFGSLRFQIFHQCCCPIFYHNHVLKPTPSTLLPIHFHQSQLQNQHLYYFLSKFHPTFNINCLL